MSIFFYKIAFCVLMCILSKNRYLMIVFAIEDKKFIFMKFYAHHTLQIMQYYEKKKARASLTDKFSVVIKVSSLNFTVV